MSAPLQVPTAADSASAARRGLVLFGVLGIFLAGFALGRTGTGVRAEAAQAAMSRVKQDDLAAARDSLPDALKYEIFLQESARALPLGLVAKGFDTNENLVLYATRVPQWRALTAVQQSAIMGVIGASYTAFRLQNGMTKDLVAGHPVISLASTGGEVLATRNESGRVILFASVPTAGPASAPAPQPDQAADTSVPPPAAP